MDLSEKEVKRLARMGARATYGMAVTDLIEMNEQVYAVSADLGKSSGLSRLMGTKPDHFLNAGIAEQNMIGVAAGLAVNGLIPFASSFASFISLRCLEQLKMNLGYMKLNVKIIGLGGGLAMGELGVSHYGWEDIAAIRSIPGVTIIEPADCTEIVKSVHAAAEYKGPVYIRLTGGTNCSIVYHQDYDFMIGKGDVLKKGSDIALIAAGSMVSEAVCAAQTLEEKGMNVTVVNMHTIKPIDEVLLKELCSQHKLIFTIEEHSVIGGLGSAVAEICSAFGHTAVIRIGLPDCYGHTASYEYQLERYGLKAEKIAETVLENYKAIH